MTSSRACAEGESVPYMSLAVLPKAAVTLYTDGRVMVTTATDTTEMSDVNIDALADLLLFVRQMRGRP